MGSGKSYWGRRLAERLGCRFIDLDDRIEALEGRPVSELFAAHGEAWFRQREADCLRQTQQWPEAVIAAGGGTPCFHENMRWMNDHGRTIFLDAPVELLARRLGKGQTHRPLIQGLGESELPDFIRDKLTERMPFYRQAQVILRVDGDGFWEKLVAAAEAV